MMRKNRERFTTLKGYVVKEMRETTPKPLVADRMSSLENKVRNMLRELKKDEIIVPPEINYDELINSITNVYKIRNFVAVTTKYGEFVLSKMPPEKIKDSEHAMIDFPFDGRKIIVCREGKSYFYIFGIEKKQNVEVYPVLDDLPDLSEFLTEE